jgi:hypothetical protein
MPGLVPGIHVLQPCNKSWMAGTSPAMTKGFMSGHDDETYCVSIVMPRACRSNG